TACSAASRSSAYEDRGEKGMSRTRIDSVACPVCGESRPPRDIVHRDLVHSPIAELIHRERPDWPGEDVICLRCLNPFRAMYVEQALREQIGELSQLDQEVVRSLKEQELVSENVNADVDAGLTLGQRVADRVAEFGGSWSFILSFGVVLLAWIAVNSTAW